MQLDHVGINVKDLDESINFYSDWLGLEVIHKWEDSKQAFLGNDSFVVGLIESPDFNYSQNTMAHIALAVNKDSFYKFVLRLRANNANVVSGPKPQRDGETVLFRDPSGNVIEVCYPSFAEWKFSKTSPTN